MIPSSEPGSQKIFWIELEHKYQNIFKSAKIAPRKKTYTISACIRKYERSKIHNLTSHIYNLEKDKQIKLKARRSTKTENKKKSKSCFFERAIKFTYL